MNKKNRFTPSVSAFTSSVTFKLGNGAKLVQVVVCVCVCVIVTEQRGHLYSTCGYVVVHLPVSSARHTYHQQITPSHRPSITSTVYQVSPRAPPVIILLCVQTGGEVFQVLIYFSIRWDIAIHSRKQMQTNKGELYRKYDRNTVKALDVRHIWVYWYSVF